jgi:hypothetical protein
LQVVREKRGTWKRSREARCDSSSRKASVVCQTADGHYINEGVVCCRRGVSGYPRPRVGRGRGGQPGGEEDKEVVVEMWSAVRNEEGRERAEEGMRKRGRGRGREKKRGEGGERERELR